MKSKEEMAKMIPKGARFALEILEKNGYEGYVVGGAVRDCVMGAEPHDWDITTNATPDQVKECFRKTIDTGIQHGTVTAMIDGEGYEITTYRADGDYSDGRHPDNVAFVKDITEDLARRDFTINAMAMDKDGNIVDPFGGLSDIENKKIRCVGNPDDRFSEDALRIMRAVRFEAKLGFSLDENTANAIQNHAEALKKVSAERIHDELTKILVSKNPTKGMEDAYKYGITKVVLPEFDAMMECEQNSKYHYTDVGHHTLDVVEGVPADSNLRWAALMHDMGKPKVKTTDAEGFDHFKGHSEVSVEIAKDVCMRLRFSNNDRDEIVDLVENHDVMPNSDSKVRRFAADYGLEFVERLHLLQVSDGKAHAKDYLDACMSGRQVFYDKCKQFIEDGTAIKISNLDINGNELMQIGLKGKSIGEFLEKARSACLGQPELNKKEFLIQQAAKMAKKEENRLASRSKSVDALNVKTDVSKDTYYKP